MECNNHLALPYPVFAVPGPCAALSCAWWPILLRGEVDTAHRTNYLCGEQGAFTFQLENADVFTRLRLMNRIVRHRSRPPFSQESAVGPSRRPSAGVYGV